MWRRLIAMEKHKISRHYCTGECLPISRDLAIDLLVYDGETSRNPVTPSWLNCWYILLKYSPQTSMEEHLAGPRTQPRCICKSSSQPPWIWHSPMNGKYLTILELFSRLLGDGVSHFRHSLTFTPPCPTRVCAFLTYRFTWIDISIDSSNPYK